MSAPGVRRIHGRPAAEPAAANASGPGAVVRFVDAAAPVELANEKPDPRRAAPAGGDWTALPAPAGEGIRWSKQNLEARWARPLELWGVELVFFTFRRPDVQVPDLAEIALRRWDPSRRRWVRVDAECRYDASRRRCLAALLEAGYVSIIGRFPAPVSATLLRVRLEHPPSQCALHDVRALQRPVPGPAGPAPADLGHAARDRREYDAFVAREFPRLANDVERCPAEEALRFFRARLKPYRGRALLGLKDGVAQTGVDWDHTVLEEREKGCGPRAGTPLVLTFWTGAPPRPAGAHARRGLRDGWLPAVTTVRRDRGIEYRLETFVQPAAGGRSLTRIRCRIANRADGARDAALTLALAALAKLFPRTWRLADLGARRRGAWLLDAAGRPLLRIPRGGRFQRGLENTLRYQWRLEPGARRSLEFAVARLAPPDAAPAVPARPGSWARAERTFRECWRDTLAGGAVIHTPDARLNALWNALLTQCLVTAENGRLPYGAFPSRYDGSVFGIEEGWTLQALATAGFGRDALRYVDGTYLTDSHLDKANYHHQYRAGYTLLFAHSLARLAADDAWLRERIERLRVEADWIRAARRRTMRPTSGPRPLHWGLLPYHYYGGDVHEPAYSLHPNAVCWRGLRDFGLMAQSLGRPDAALYLDEAAAYKRQLEDVIERTIRRGAAETFLSMKLYWDKPYPYNPVFWPLFLSMTLETGVLDPAGRDARGLRAWLRRRRCTLAGVPVLYPMRLDPVYGLGLAWCALRDGRLDEYLKTVAAYRTFLTDSYFHTAPESGDLLLRDEDADWEIRSEDNLWRQWMNPSSPLTSGAAILFLLVRHMLALEERDAEGRLNGRLIVMPACPRSWCRPGARVRVARLATELGELGFAVSVRSGPESYRCRIEPVPARGCRELGLRLRPLAGVRAVRLAVNGRKLEARPDALGTLWLPADAPTLDVRVMRPARA